MLTAPPIQFLTLALYKFIYLLTYLLTYVMYTGQDLVPEPASTRAPWQGRRHVGGSAAKRGG